MKNLLFISFSAALLAACGGEAENAEVAEVENPVVEPLGTEANAAGGAVAWDANNDRMFDRNEFTGMGDRGFLGWDADNDKRLSQSEFEQGWTQAGFQNGGEVFTQFDDNNDTFLGNDEFFSEDEFTTWDKDGNGILENSEFGYYGAA